jgi:large subunit ribosomal protein L21
VATPRSESGAWAQERWLLVSNDFAVVETGGRQFKVHAGDTVDVELMPGASGETVELDRVLLLSSGGQVSVGSPTVAGARVVATIAGVELADKIIVFKYKAKTRSRVKTGHRQKLTRLSIKEIVAG